MYSHLGKEPSKNLGNKTLTLILTVVLGLGAAALHADVTTDTNWDTDADPYHNNGDGQTAPGGGTQNDADNVFCQDVEIDENSKSDCTDNREPGQTIPGLTDAAVVYDFVQDSLPADKNDISMHKPGNKDILPLSQWGCADKPASDKGNLLGAMMTAFDGNGDGEELGDLHLFGAVDRFSNNGNAQLGVWLLQEDVSCDSSETAQGGSFKGKHTNFDVLLISNFTQGGTLANVQAYYWMDPDYYQCIDGGGTLAFCAPKKENGDECVGSPGPLPLDGSEVPECTKESDDLIEEPFIIANICTGGTPDQELCAETNTAELTPIWPTASKTGGSGVLAENMYFEVAINFGALVPNSSEICLGSFLFESRASQSIDANLFDYAYGSLNTCGDLTIIKVTDPTGDSTEFDFAATEGAGSGGTDLDGSPAKTSDDGLALEFADLVPGTYNAAEVGPLPTDWDLDDINCVDGDSADVVSNASPNPAGDNIDVDIDIGDSITCTFTNIKPPKLKLVKTVTTDDGGTAVPDSWTLYARKLCSSDDTDPNCGFSNAGGSGVSNELLAGISYRLWESDGPNGYTAGSWSCDGGSLSVSGSTNITLANGDDVICTINNDDIAPTLKLVKSVTTDDGGSAVPNDWTLSADGPTLGAGDRDFSNAGGSGGFNTVYAGNGGYDLSETTVAGYQMVGEWSCDGGSYDSSADNITLGLDDDITCTVTNDDIAPRLKLVKSVTTDDGGTAVGDDWTLYADGPTLAAGDRDFNNKGASGDFNTVYAGNGGYNLSESTVTGYQMVGEWSCDGGSYDSSGDNITLGLNEDVTCTVTNDDLPPKLKLVKTVTTDDGGTAGPNDWTLFARKLCADGDTNPDCGFSNAGGSGNFTEVLANTNYRLFETGPGGYTAGAWSCDGGTQSGSNINLDIGSEVTCTINNDDIPPELKLVKTVTTDDGGTQGPADWTLYARKLCGTGDTNPDCGFNNAGDAGQFNELLANIGYRLFETGPDGYTAGNWSCDGGSQSGSNITLGLADKVTCTINNDDIPPELKLVKTVTTDDGGTAVPDSWTLHARKLCGSGDTNPDCGFNNAGGSGVFNELLANIGYRLFETGPGGYTASNWSCDGGSQSGSNITLGLADKVTCTINNDDVPPELKLVKTVTTDDGGTEGPADWTLYARKLCGAGDTNPDCGFNNAGDAGQFNELLANIGYRLFETGPGGYTAGNWSCDGGSQSGSNITLGLADKVTCTINNDDIAPTLTLIKGVDEGLGELLPTTAADQWTLTANGPGSDRDIDTSVDTFTLAVDPAPYDSKASTNAVTAYANGSGYDLAEQQQSGYRLKTDWSCTGDGLSSNTVTLDLDEDTTCTIVNERLAQVDLVKTFESGPIPAGESFTFQIRSGASSAAEGTILDTEVVDSTTVQPVVFDIYLNPGNAYQFCELVAAGYSTSLAQGVPYTAGGPWFVPGVAPNGMNESDNGIVCVDFTPQVGELVNFVVDNTPPPGGMARTIGYWKNWTSCDGKGNQDQQGGTLLDDQFPLKVHDNFVIGVAPYADNACPIAVDLIDKRDVDNESEVRDGKKMANDVHGMVAQMLASMANRSGGFAGVGACAAIDSVIEDARTFLLVDVMFYTEGIDPALAGDSNVVEYLPSNYRNSDLADSEKINRQDYRDLRSLMLDFATYFNDYNNNFACGTPPVYPAP